MILKCYNRVYMTDPSSGARVSWNTLSWAISSAYSWDMSVLTCREVCPLTLTRVSSPEKVNSGVKYCLHVAVSSIKKKVSRTIRCTSDTCIRRFNEKKKPVHVLVNTGYILAFAHLK